MRVCPECLDRDHPQLQVGRIRINDPQALRGARSNKAENAVADTPVPALVFPFFPPISTLSLPENITPPEISDDTPSIGDEISVDPGEWTG